MGMRAMGLVAVMAACACGEEAFLQEVSLRVPHEAVRFVRAHEGGALAWVGEGVFLFDGTSWTPIKAERTAPQPAPEALPKKCPLRDPRVQVEVGDRIWVGGPEGAAWHDGKRWHFRAGRRWLPDDRVNDIHVAEDGSAWIATEGGLAHIEFKEMTLSEKAVVFEKQVRDRHVRYGLVTGCGLREPGDLSTSVTGTDDNDGLWTGMYVAAECFRYAVTKDEEARRFADESFDAMEKLEAITGIPGFPARSFVKKGENTGGGEWHPTEDGEWIWKGDTSSDEIVGHFFAFSIYYDLCADEARKERVRTLVRRIMDHIIEHDWYLVDQDGKPTSWGKWNPKYLSRLTEGFFARGLQSLEVLSHLKAAYHITGDEKYQKAYRELIDEHGYARNTIHQKINLPRVTNHSDDELAFLSYYPLLQYEDDEELRAIYLESIERSWKVEAPERCPLWDCIYASAVDEPPSLANAERTLREIPLDLVEWKVDNSKRPDVKKALINGRHDEPQLTRVLPADERPIMKWNGNPYKIEGGGNGHGEEAATYWLLPYWMGRHHGSID